MRTRRRIIALVAALLATLELAGPSETRAQSPRAGTVISAGGRVEIVRAGAAQAAGPGAELHVGDLVRTGPESRVAILLADESRLKLNANSALRIKAVAARPARGVVPAAVRAAKTLLGMLVGELWVDTDAPPGTLEIDTDTVTASIKGTELDLRVGTDGESHLTVLRGVVDYRNPLGALTLAPGEVGIARVGQAPRKEVRLTPADAVQWTLSFPGIVSARDYPFVTADPARLDDLLREARATVAAAPADLDRRVRLGELLHDRGERTEARSVFTLVTAAAPAHPGALTGLGWIALEAGRGVEALDLFAAVTPPTARSLLGRSIAHFRRGDVAAARADLEESLRRFGPSAPALAQRAVLALVGSDVRAAQEDADAALRLDPGLALAHGLLSNIALTFNRKADAGAAARRAVAANPRSPSAHLDLSLVLQADFKLDDALAAARAAVDLDPGNARAHLQVARLLFGFDRVEDAAAAAQRARSLDPAEPLVHATLGFILLARGDTAAAGAAFQRALQLGSAPAETYLGLGLVAFRQGRVEDGLRALQAAVALEPGVSLFHSYLAKALYQVGRRDEALAALARARELDPRDPTPELYHGIFLRDLNRPAAAIAAFQRSVELNDHRAVYRSRLLLDRDLATRNVDLALAYGALGQGARALATGIHALHEDPQSSSAHRFFASVIGASLGAYQPGQSELLQTRMLLPVNQNTFNTFNDYTSLLEQPRLYGAAQGGGGSFGQRNGSLELFGGTSRVAASGFASYSAADGPKPKNDDDLTWAVDTFLKWAPTFRSSSYLQFLHLESEGGDIFVDQRGFTKNDPDLRRQSTVTLLEAGYQIQTRPENNLLLYAHGQIGKTDVRDQTVLLRPIPGFPAEVFTEQLSQRILVTDRAPYYSVQAAYLDRLGAHQVWFAADYFNGEPEERVKITAVSDILLSGSIVTSSATLPTVRQTTGGRRQYVSLVAHDTWQALPTLYLTGALRLDIARDVVGFSDVKNDSVVPSPQAGVLWRVTPAHTLRVAAFQSFQTQSHAVLSPTHIAGFFIDNPVAPSSTARQYHAAWDADLSPTTFFTLGGFRRVVDSPALRLRDDGSFGTHWVTRERSGINAAVNQMFGTYWGASLGYLRLYRDEPEGTGTDDHLVAGLNFVHPLGILVGLSVAYVHQDLGSLRAPGAPGAFWVASLGASYEFPDKRAVLSVGVQNVFDERFDFRRIFGIREDIVVSELPAIGVFASLRVNF